MLSSDGFRYIPVDANALDVLLTDLFVESNAKAPKEIWLDLDATDDPLHGQQEGRLPNVYYEYYCNLLLYIFREEHLLCARPRRSNVDAADGSIEELGRIVAQI